MTILNIGCGRYPLEGAVNHDKELYCDHVDITHDLDEYPWPWDDEEFDEIHAMDVLEHLKDFVKSLEECHRILKLGGRMNIRVPHFAYEIAYDDPTHRCLLTPKSVDYFIEGTEYCKSFGFYSPMRWKKLSCEVEDGNIWFVLEKVKCVEHFSL